MYIIWVPFITYMHKNGDLKRMPVHFLDFMIILEDVVFCNVNCKQYKIFWKRLHTCVILFILKVIHIVVINEFLQSRSEVIQ